jgi:hypothetical protein
VNSPATPQAGRLRRFGRGIRDFVSECAYAQRRMTELATAPDRYSLNPDRPPDTYAEFLFRTSGVLRHEPPARTRVRQ